MRFELHKRVFLNFVLVIALFGILGSLVGARLISRTTLNEAQRRVSLDLRSAWSVLQSELDKLGLYVSVLGTGKRIKEAYAAPDSQAYRASLEAVRRQCGKIRLGYKQEEKDARFEVWNEGKGLTPDKIQRVFEKFVRFESEKEVSRSTGLGLFITKDIINKHGGTIWAESQDGKWINFIFTFPG